MEDDKVMHIWWTAEGKVVLELMGRAIIMSRAEAETLFVDMVLGVFGAFGKFDERWPNRFDPRQEEKD